jgi:hypothetical protein
MNEMQHRTQASLGERPLPEVQKERQRTSHPKASQPPIEKRTSVKREASASTIYSRTSLTRIESEAGNESFQLRTEDARINLKVF